jgi:SecD/SecF fusion protein
MNKSAILTLTIVISLLCAYFLQFTFVGRRVQQEARDYATKNGKLDVVLRQKYIDSVWTKPVYNFLGFEHTYKDVKTKELSLGLDLQGGMHVTLEVSPAEILRAMSGNSSDPQFNEALKAAQANQKASQDNFVDLFAAAYNRIAPDGSLARVFTNTSTRGRISLTSSNREVISVITSEVNEAIDRAFQIIRTRIDKFGVANPNIMKIPGTGRILVELPGVENPEQVRKLLSGVAKLEFWEVYETQDMLAALEQFNAFVQKEDLLKKGTKPDSKKVDDKKEGSGLVAKTDQDEQKETQLKAKTDSVKADTAKKANELIAKTDSTKKDTSKTAKKETKKDSTQNLLGSQLLMPSMEGFTVKIQDTARVNNLLARSEVKTMFPSNTKFLWDVKADEKSGTITLYTIKKSKGNKAPLEGDVIVDARQDFDEGKPDVNMQMNGTGARIWKKMTGSNIGKRIAIVLDNYVYSAPRVNGEIPTGNSQISGNFTVDEAKVLASVLKAGKLPAPTRIVEEATVGPSLGQESINQGLSSMLWGMLTVVVFMILYYKSSGLVANIALLFNIFFIIGILAQFGAVLTLPGMAGIVLTIGMSVDANVLIFERIREELRNGKSMVQAINLGYEKAYSSIIDANVTTLLIAVILLYLGAGPIKGFATTLIIGILCSLFTAIFITRMIIEYFTRNPQSKIISFDAYILQNAFVGSHLNFVSLRRQAYIFSGVLILIGFAIMITQGGLNLGVDFKGGRSYVVEFKAPVSVAEARTALSKQFTGNTEIKTYGGETKLKITTSYLIENETIEADKQVEAKLLGGLSPFQDKSPKIVSFSKVGATIADDIYNTSLLTIVLSLIVIFVYILIRFRRWQYGLGAVIALFHDVLMVFAWMAIARMFGFAYEVDQVFIAAMLTVIGYSINDTVVVFDRIREFAGDTDQKDFDVKLNSAVNDTLSRTIMTSGTTLIVVVALYILGGQVLSGFSYALLIGILFGTYSSVFIASPIVLDISLIQFRKQQAQLPVNAKPSKPTKAS